MIDKTMIEQLVVSAARNAYQESKLPFPDGDVRDIRLYGGEGALDSLALVSLIVDVEQLLEDEFGLSLVLADERAMSTRRSPFRSVGTFCDYVSVLAHEQLGGEA